MTDTEFKISQLRQDKIIYAVESCTISLGSMVLLLLSTMLAKTWPFFSNVAILLAVFALGYLIYMGLGNYRRLLTILELEKKL